MFINDGKSLFGNVGLIVSIVILIVLLFFSYNKCMATSTKLATVDKTNKDKIEGFGVDDPEPTSTAVVFPPPENIRVNISGATVTLNFVVDITAGKPVPNKFMVVLVQYDSNMKPTGNNKFYISSEYKINSSVSLSSIRAGATNNLLSGNNLCELINGAPACQYVFNNLDMVDATGNPYYYKIGVSAVYDSGNSAFTIPYNIINQNGIFSLTSPLDAQNNQFSEYIKYKQMQSPTTGKGTSYSSATSTADGQYELIKSQLGGYPSNLIMDPTSAKQNLLADLVDKSMSQARLNINVGTPNIGLGVTV